MDNEISVVEQEKAAALHGHAVSEPCEKCMEAGYGYGQHFGGAKSFAELKAYREVQKDESSYYMATLDYRDLAENILNDEDMSVSQKADALGALVDEFKQVVHNVDFYYDTKEVAESSKPYSSTSELPDNIQDLPAKKKRQWMHVFNSTFKKTGDESAAFAAANSVAKKEVDEDKAGKRMNRQQVSKLQSAFDTIKNVFDWASYDDDEPEVVEELEKALSFDDPSGFKVISTPSGLRWMAYSSNAFKDLDNELFTTAALEEAVEYADKSNDRGPLRVFHVKGADIGDCDFQCVIGRFLFETGTFRDDDLGSKAVEYLTKNKDKQFQVSIGYQYLDGDEKDGVYDWLRIKERSVTPHGDAANPFTSFAFGVEGEMLDERKVTMLTEMFGEDAAKNIIGKAEGKTKELEETVSFKEADLTTAIKSLVSEKESIDLEDLTGLIDKYSKKPKDGEEEDEKKEEKSTEEEAAKEDEIPESLLVAIQTIGERLNEIGESVTTLQGEVKELKERKTSRGSDAFLASESKENLLNKESIKDILGEQDNKPVNPVRGYIEDLAGIGLRG